MTSQFGALVRRLRLRAELTQEDLAERAGLGVRTVRGLETGERADPRVGTVRRLADAFALDEADRVELFAAAGLAKPADPRLTDSRLTDSRLTDPGPAEPGPPEPGPTEPSPTDSQPVGAAPGAAVAARPRLGAVDERLAVAADELAHAVRVRWQREEEQRQVHDPFPLPVRWRAVADELTDSWANVRRAGAGAAAEPLDLAGGLAEVVDVYRRIPSGRLVVLGGAGSGKTILTLRFVLDLLATRASGEPVPVVFRLGSWNPTTTALRDWLTAQLLRDHPGLHAAGPDGSTLAAALVETDRVLPVLDGFDEIADGLHRAALEALNATRLPLLLTSRPEEYAAAVAGTDVLTAACGVALTGLTPDDLADYLPRTTRGAAWAPVVAALRAEPDGRLAEVLAAPLMVGLARAVYSDTPGRDPACLLDTARFPTAAAIEEHLLGSLVPTLYRYQPENGRFQADRVERYLAHLARHLHRLGTRDLAWWQLGGSLPLPVRMLAVGAAMAVPVWVLDTLVETAVFGFSAFRVVFSGAFGVVAGLAVAVAHLVLTRRDPAGVEPVRVRVRIRPGPGSPGSARVLARAKAGFLAGAVLGLAFGVVREVVGVLVTDQARGILFTLIDALVFGVAFGTAAALMAAVVARCEAPLDVRSAGSPGDLLRTNRRTVLVQLMVFGPVFALAVPVVSWLLVLLLQRLPDSLGVEFFWLPLFGLLLGVFGGLVGGLGYALGMTAWGQWVLFARICLPLAGRLPWAVPAFLDDAYRRGVLRRAGAVYQFRHARLQDHLAATGGR